MLKVKELLEATNGKLLNGNLDDEINNYKIEITLDTDKDKHFYG